MPESNQKLFIVGVGASAGGLDALTKLVAHMPKKSDNFAVIIAQHLSPDHKSRMVDLLSRTSRWKVVQAENNQKIEAKRIYMTPPEHEVSVEDGKVKLVQHQRERKSVPSVDKFFESLAMEYRNFSIGVVMSGTGSDGTDGCKSIREERGYVLVQDPEEAQHEGMPSSAIKAGAYDRVLLAEQMGEEISRYLENYHLVNGGDKQPKDDSLRHIFKLMNRKTGTDFSRYKPSTIKRRIERRLDALKLKDIDDYREHIQESPAELDELFKTVLIGVTGFFRDEEAFEALKKQLKNTLDQKESGQSIRIWSVGCATGEEPYSVAIMLEELLEEMNEDYQIQIFATDIDEYALSVGRKGYYNHEQVQSMPRELLRKYFTAAPNGYEIKKHIRQMVLFSKHDITVDPPFVRLDLVSCRNLLIYFDQELQKEVIPIFHYALNEGGKLLLGKSENVSEQTDLFAAENGKQKIFYRKKGAHNTLKFNKFRKNKNTEKEREPQPRPEMSIEEIAEQTLVKTFEHPYVVIDENLEVAYIKGKLQPYTDLDEGVIDSNLLKIVNKDLHMEIRTLFAKCKKQREPIKGTITNLRLNDQDHFVRLKIKPLVFTRSNGQHFMIIFERIEDHIRLPVDQEYASWEDDWKAMRITELEQELSATKEHLHTFTEELETSNEELQSLNEELQSANEELKSSNEELETSNEELQSANEELSTSNAELNNSNEELLQKENELTRIKEDLELTREKFYLALENTDIFIFYQNAKLEYNWVYNPFPPVPTEQMIGKNDLELKWIPKEDAEKLHDVKQQALKEGEDTELEIKISDEWYDLKIMPQTKRGKVTGIYGVGIGITERKTAADIIERNESTLRNIINQGSDNVIAVDRDFKVLTVNNNISEEFYTRYKVQVRQGDNLLKCLEKVPDVQEKSREFFESTFNGETIDLGIYEVANSSGSGKKFFEGSFFSLYDTEKRIIGGVNIGRDVTERVILERQVQEIIKRSANLTGKDFFEDLTAQLSNVFNMRYVYVGIFQDQENTLRTYALRVDGQLSNDFVYTLPQTPCGQAVEKDQQIHLEGVQQRFPDDPKLQRWNVESYIGIPIDSPQSEQSLGVLVMMDDKPWKGSPFADYLLALFSLRAGAELERMRAERESRGKSKQLDNITSNVPGVLYELTQSQKGEIHFSYISQNCNALFEITQDELYQDADQIKALMHKEDQEAYETSRVEAAQKQGYFKFECRILTKNTRQFKWIKFDSRAIKNKNGGVNWYGFIEDISNQKLAADELLEAKETAEKAARAKEDFLSTMSHEIRTPLNAIIGLSQLLLRRKPRTDQEENLKTLRFSSENLMSLINDILDFNKLEAGNVEMDDTDYRLKDLLESIRQAHLPYADELGNQIVLEIGDDVPDTLRGDQLKLGQVLNNLISNANKFTVQGKIIVSVSLFKQDKDQVDLEFRIKDEGIGISKEKINRIFDKFTQADSSTQRQYGGTGLGLSISRSLLELMGTSIGVKSKPNDGSEFYFTLQQQIGDAQRVDAEIPQGNGKDLTKIKNLRVLLVEDVAINRMVIQQYLEEWWEIQADEAVNGEEALALAQENTYDLIMMDIRMPKMNGHEATKNIRALNSPNASIPIIALTADTSAIDNGHDFTDIITKPFNPDELLKKMLHYTKHLEASNQPASEPADKPAVNKDIDFAQAESKYDFAPDKMKQFYTLALKAVDEYRANYMEGLQQQDFQQLSDAMHKARLIFDMLEENTLYNKMYDTRRKVENGETPGALSEEIEGHRSKLDKLLKRIQKRLDTLDKI